MILDPDPQGWAHIATALKIHVAWCRDNGIAVPSDVSRLRELASGRQGTTNEQTSGDPLHAALVQTKLTATYAEAGDTLNVSKRTIERLVAAGTLPSVVIGGVPRIRISDLERFVSSLAPSRRTFRDDVDGKRAS